ncbi:MAG: YbaN family protein [Acidimicrobiales bacterium]
MTPGDAQPTGSVARNRVVRGVWFIAGWLAVGVGAVGIVVPGLPTTVFFIIAAWCFGKSSPRFERWVLDLPRIGPMVRSYREGLGMPRRAKVAALTMMWIAIAISAVFLRDRLAIVVVVIALGLIGSAYIVWRVPTREQVRSVGPPEHHGNARQ